MSGRHFRAESLGYTVKYTIELASRELGDWSATWGEVSMIPSMSKTVLREARVTLDAYFVLLGKFEEFCLLVIVVRVERDLRTNSLNILTPRGNE